MNKNICLFMFEKNNKVENMCLFFWLLFRMFPLIPLNRKNKVLLGGFNILLKRDDPKTQKAVEVILTCSNPFNNYPF